MDIKDFILIGGGLLIAAVVAHGFWIAWRDRRQDLRIDIKPDLIPEEVSEIERLRGELPNGGGRPAKWPDPRQDMLDLEPPPLLLEPTDAPPMEERIEPSFPAAERADPEEVDAVLFGSDWREAAAGHDDLADKAGSARETETSGRMEPVLGADEPMLATSMADQPMISETDDSQGSSGRSSGRSKVTEVALPDPIVADEPKRPRRLGQRRNSAADREGVPAGRESAATGRESAATGRGSTATGRGNATSDRPSAPSARNTREESREVAAAVPVEELIVLNVLADPARPFRGDELFTTLRTCGLKFGEMNIFHRVEPLTKSVQYSIASAVEPGTFDMADMEAISCPGLCIFMQLPGPEDPAAAFEDLLSVAKSVVKSLGGDVRDEHRNVMTSQTEEHYRQRIVDFSRRRMSKRA